MQSIPLFAYSFFFVSLLLIQTVSSTSCGEPLTGGSQCDDYHCTRNLNGYCVRGLPQGANCTTDNDCFHGLECSNATTRVCVSLGSTKDVALGYVAIVVAVACWGSNFIPVKKYDTGNGMYFQWVLATGIWIVGLLVQLIRRATVFYEYAMVGGVLWATGNLLTVPIIKCVGLGLGLALWGSVNMVMGWMCGHFGLFGMAQESVNNPSLNYVGLALSIVATICFGFVEPNSDRSEEDEYDDSTNKYLIDQQDYGQGGNGSFFDTMPKGRLRLFGCVGSVIAGMLYSVNLVPPLSLMDHYDSKSLSGDRPYSAYAIDYVFSHFCGIYLAATFYFAVYCAVRGYTPTMFPPVEHIKIVLPALVSGAMWAIAQSAAFVANDNLGMVVAYPMMCTGPSLLGSIWGVVLFKEIKGTKNFAVLGLAFALIAASATCASMSKT
eukprot:PhF_6_TR12893/c0_g1_i1/m.20293